MFSQAIINMTGLVSLELEMGSPPEALLFTESQCASPSFLPNLRAASLYDYSTAGRLVARRPVEYLRIRTMIDAGTFPDFMTALRLDTVVLKCLQVWVAVPNVASAAIIVDRVTREVPSLTSLGITFTFPSPRWTARLSVIPIPSIRDPD